MLEISVLIALARYTHRTAEQKGYPGTLFAVIAVVSWFGGGIAGVGVGMASEDLNFDGISVGGIVGYLVGVAIAGTVNCMIVSALPEGQPQRNPTYDRRRQQAMEEWEYVERRRGESARRERDDEEEEVVPLTQAPARLPVAHTVESRSEPPRAKRAWRPKW